TGAAARGPGHAARGGRAGPREQEGGAARARRGRAHAGAVQHVPAGRHHQGEGVRGLHRARPARRGPDRKSTRLNSSHGSISYAVFCLKKKKKKRKGYTRNDIRKTSKTDRKSTDTTIQPSI